MAYQKSKSASKTKKDKAWKQVPGLKKASKKNRRTEDKETIREK